MTRDVLHDRLLGIALSLPEATEDWPWGSVHCKVRGKIFVGWSRDHNGVMSLGVRTSMDRQALLVATDPAVSIAKYVGKYGGIDIALDEHPDWDDVEEFVVESYRLIAPKRLAKTLDQSDTPGTT